MRHLILHKLFPIVFVAIICSSFQTADRSLLSADFERPYKVKQYLLKYRYLSIELNQATRIPIPIIIAMAGLESNWGTSDLAKKANNHFGIKIKNSWEESYCKYTQEYLDYYGDVANQCFRKYKLIRESYVDFGRFLTQRDPYRQLLRYPEWDYINWAYGLEHLNYATDPYYAEKLVRIIEDYRLHEVR
ncbi:MAG: glucosaminidase domain-containing protein [Saprospiraceae bacterium]|nr:glucosaminidase domain-containing protein [Saprospiraceae bacterium]